MESSVYLGGSIRVGMPYDTHRETLLRSTESHFSFYLGGQDDAVAVEADIFFNDAVGIHGRLGRRFVAKIAASHALLFFIIPGKKNENFGQSIAEH